MKALSNKYNFRIIILLSTTIATTLLCVYGLWLFAVIAFIIWVWSLTFFLKYDRYYSHKIAIILDAIENNDQTFRYPEKGISTNDTLVNNTLNRITKIIFQTKIDITQKERYFEYILNSINTGIVVIDEKGSVYQTNSEALRLLGLHSFNNVAQLRFIDESLIQKVLDFKPGNIYQLSFNNERGEVNLSVRVSELILSNVPVKILTFNDIKNELDAKEIDSWIRLIRVLTHEIMNSITPITSLTETLLSMSSTKDKDIRNGLEVISQTGKNLMGFVDSYRKFTHIPQPEPSLFYMKPFLERMIELSKYQIKTKSKIEYIINIKPNDLILYADENLITQIILNLIKNAIQAIENERKEGLIEIEAFCNEKEEVIIYVSNNGPLIPSEEMEHIFVPFYTTKEGGSGIGLALSRQIMRVMGGSLTLKTNYNLHKTTFILTFP